MKLSGTPAYARLLSDTTGQYSPVLMLCCSDGRIQLPLLPLRRTSPLFHMDTATAYDDVVIIMKDFPMSIVMKLVDLLKTGRVASTKRDIVEISEVIDNLMLNCSVDLEACSQQAPYFVATVLSSAVHAPHQGSSVQKRLHLKVSCLSEDICQTTPTGPNATGRSNEILYDPPTTSEESNRSILDASPTADKNNQMLIDPSPAAEGNNENHPDTPSATVENIESVEDSCTSSSSSNCQLAGKQNQIPSEQSRARKKHKKSPKVPSRYKTRNSVLLKDSPTRIARIKLPRKSSLAVTTYSISEKKSAPLTTCNKCPEITPEISSDKAQRKTSEMQKNADEIPGITSLSSLPKQAASPSQKCNWIVSEVLPLIPEKLTTNSSMPEQCINISQTTPVCKKSKSELKTSRKRETLRKRPLLSSPRNDTSASKLSNYIASDLLSLTSQKLTETTSTVSLSDVQHKSSARKTRNQIQLITSAQETSQKSSFKILQSPSPCTVLCTLETSNQITSDTQPLTSKKSSGTRPTVELSNVQHESPARRTRNKTQLNTSAAHETPGKRLYKTNNVPFVSNISDEIVLNTLPPPASQDLVNTLSSLEQCYSDQLKSPVRTSESIEQQSTVIQDLPVSGSHGMLFSSPQNNTDLLESTLAAELSNDPQNSPACRTRNKTLMKTLAPRKTPGKKTYNILPPNNAQFTSNLSVVTVSDTLPLASDYITNTPLSQENCYINQAKSPAVGTNHDTEQITIATQELPVSCSHTTLLSSSPETLTETTSTEELGNSSHKYPTRRPRNNTQLKTSAAQKTSATRQYNTLLPSTPNNVLFTSIISDKIVSDTLPLALENIAKAPSPEHRGNDQAKSPAGKTSDNSKLKTISAQELSVRSSHVTLFPSPEDLTEHAETTVVELSNIPQKSPVRRTRKNTRLKASAAQNILGERQHNMPSTPSNALCTSNISDEIVLNTLTPASENMVITSSCPEHCDSEEPKSPTVQSSVDSKQKIKSEQEFPAGNSHVTHFSSQPENLTELTETTSTLPARRTRNKTRREISGTQNTLDKRQYNTLQPSALSDVAFMSNISDEIVLNILPLASENLVNTSSTTEHCGNDQPKSSAVRSGESELEARAAQELKVSSSHKSVSSPKDPLLKSLNNNEIASATDLTSVVLIDIPAAPQHRSNAFEISPPLYTSDIDDLKTVTEEIPADSLDAILLLSSTKSDSLPSKNKEDIASSTQPLTSANLTECSTASEQFSNVTKECPVYHTNDSELQTTAAQETFADRPRVTLFSPPSNDSSGIKSNVSPLTGEKPSCNPVNSLLDAEKDGKNIDSELQIANDEKILSSKQYQNSVDAVIAAVSVGVYDGSELSAEAATIAHSTAHILNVNSGATSANVMTKVDELCKEFDNPQMAELHSTNLLDFSEGVESISEKHVHRTYVRSQQTISSGFTCAHCCMKFDRKVKLQNHMRIHFSSDGGKAPAPKKPNTGKSCIHGQNGSKPYKCGLCMKKFCFISVPEKCNNSSFVCPVCLCEYDQTETLDTHTCDMLVHTQNIGKK